MSITTHVRGDKGYKTIQGENLRKMFTQMLATEVYAVYLCFADWLSLCQLIAWSLSADWLM